MGYSWDKILDAVALLKSKRATKIKGEGFQAYWAGTIIRIDIDMKEVLNGRSTGEIKDPV